VRTGNDDDMVDDSTPKTLVVPLDGSEFALRAVPVASNLAGSFDADLLLMTTPLGGDKEMRDVPPVWLGDAATASGYARVRTVVAQDDHAAVAIAELVAELPDAAICMSTHGHGRVVSAALGSVATDVVHRVRAPVVLLGPDFVAEPNANGWMVVAHDGSAAADAILAPARAWADALGLLVTVVHVLHPLDVEGAQAPMTGISHVVSYFGEGTTVRVARSSYPAGAILDVVEEVRPLLVAMSTHGHTGLARITLGSVTTDVVRESRCPVLVTRPAALGSSDDA
jgi:nucleotide-binding universal stress UspA family protein